MDAGTMTTLVVLLGLVAGLCWGLAKVVDPGPGRVLNIGAVVLLAAAIAVLVVSGGPV
jgi:hypothetical protein